jgi:hypothetical protein
LETVWVAHCKQLCLDVLLTNTDRLYGRTRTAQRVKGFSTVSLLLCESRAACCVIS